MRYGVASGGQEWRDYDTEDDANLDDEAWWMETRDRWCLDGTGQEKRPDDKMVEGGGA